MILLPACSRTYDPDREIIRASAATCGIWNFTDDRITACLSYCRHRGKYLYRSVQLSSLLFTREAIYASRCGRGSRGIGVLYSMTRDQSGRVEYSSGSR